MWNSIETMVYTTYCKKISSIRHTLSSTMKSMVREETITLEFSGETYRFDGPIHSWVNKNHYSPLIANIFPYFLYTLALLKLPTHAAVNTPSDCSTAMYAGMRWGYYDVARAGSVLFGNCNQLDNAVVPLIFVSLYKATLYQDHLWPQLHPYLLCV